LIFTSANADAGGVAINQKIRHFTALHDNACFFVSFGSPIYLSVLAQCCGIVGNSSSGIFEAPTMGKWVVNIGPRQNGRLMSDNIISVDSTSNIKQVIKKLLLGEQSIVEGKVSFIFGTGDTSKRICKLLEDFDVQPKSGTGFYDLAGCPIAK
jgi:UDP-N-acetylglucosamine 2-epimerase